MVHTTNIWGQKNENNLAKETGKSEESGVLKGYWDVIWDKNRELTIRLGDLGVTGDLDKRGLGSITETKKISIGPSLRENENGFCLFV